MKAQVCLSCGIPWKDGIGWGGQHKSLCANDRYGWLYTKEVEVIDMGVTNMSEVLEFAKILRRQLGDRFWSKVERRGDDDCWIWKAHTSKKGYGKFDIDGRTHRAHRVAWMLAHGEIPEGLCVLHSCDTPGCVNERHLFLGDNDLNVADRNAKGRQARGSSNGWSVLTEDQVVAIKSELGDAGMSPSGIADKYGVHQRTIKDIRDGVTWTHLHKPSPSLDELREEYAYMGQGSNSSAGRLIAALESALAASQAEVERLKDGWHEQITESDNLRKEVERLRAMIVPGDAAAHEELLANLEESVRRANKVAADACVRSGENLRRAEAAERERNKLLAELSEPVRNVLTRESAAESTLARLREPLTDEECAELSSVWVDGRNTWRDSFRAVVREFLRLRGVQP